MPIIQKLLRKTKRIIPKGPKNLQKTKKYNISFLTDTKVLLNLSLTPYYIWTNFLDVLVSLVSQAINQSMFIHLNNPQDFQIDKGWQSHCLQVTIKYWCWFTKIDDNICRRNAQRTWGPQHVVSYLEACGHVSQFDILCFHFNHMMIITAKPSRVCILGNHFRFDKRYNLYARRHEEELNLQAWQRQPLWM